MSARRPTIGSTAMSRTWDCCPWLLVERWCALDRPCEGDSCYSTSLTGGPPWPSSLVWALLGLTSAATDTPTCPWDAGLWPPGCGGLDPCCDDVRVVKNGRQAQRSSTQPWRAQGCGRAVSAGWVRELPRSHRPPGKRSVWGCTWPPFGHHSIAATGAGCVNRRGFHRLQQGQIWCLAMPLPFNP
jgi:hypothetical protein